MLKLAYKLDALIYNLDIIMIKGNAHPTSN